MVANIKLQSHTLNKTGHVLSSTQAHLRPTSSSILNCTNQFDRYTRRKTRYATQKNTLLPKIAPSHKQLPLLLQWLPYKENATLNILNMLREVSGFVTACKDDMNCMADTKIVVTQKKYKDCCCMLSHYSSLAMYRTSLAIKSRQY